MKKETIQKLIAINNSMFPQFYTKLTDADLALQINVWCDLFKDVPEEQVTSAFRQVLKRTQYPVKPADVFAILDAQKQATLPNCDELFDEACETAYKLLDYWSVERGWETEWGAEKSGIEMANEIYGKLPPILREWKTSPKALLDWYRGFGTDNENFARKDFARNIEERIRRRETLGIGWGEEFKPVIDGRTFKLIGGQNG